MKAWMIVAAQLGALALAFWGGHHVASMAGAADLATANAGWAKEREQIATERADAVEAQRKAEQGQATALSQAAANYLKGKSDAEKASQTVVADLRSGALRLRDQWATCRATTAVLSSATSGPKPDGGADYREEGAGDLVRAAAECDAHVRGLQQALIGEREGQ